MASTSLPTEIEEIANWVTRSFVATRRLLVFTKIPLAVTNKVFDSLFIPILLCGSEVWGIYEKDDFNTREKHFIEKTHIFLCKKVLTVNKHCPNVVARNELGRLSLTELNTNVLHSFAKDNNIARQRLQLSLDMPEKTQSGMSLKIKNVALWY